MGATKNAKHSLRAKKTSLFGRAIASSARVEILEMLLKKGVTTNVDLTKSLGLTKSTIHSHIRKLSDAELITMEFYPNCYHIRIAEEKIEKIAFCLEEDPE